MEQRISKEALDLLTQQQIERHRERYITSIIGSGWKGSEDERYIEELSLYTSIRFKQDDLDRFQRWKTDPEIQHIFHDIPDEIIYRLKFDAFQKNYGQPIYILDLTLPEPLD